MHGSELSVCALLQVAAAPMRRTAKKFLKTRKRPGLCVLWLVCSRCYGVPVLYCHYGTV